MKVNYQNKFLQLFKIIAILLIPIYFLVNTRLIEASSHILHKIKSLPNQELEFDSPSLKLHKPKSVLELNSSKFPEKNSLKIYQISTKMKDEYVSNLAKLRLRGPEIYTKPSNKYLGKIVTEIVSGGFDVVYRNGHMYSESIGRKMNGFEILLRALYSLGMLVLYIGTYLTGMDPHFRAFVDSYLSAHYQLDDFFSGVFSDPLTAAIYYILFFMVTILAHLPMHEFVHYFFDKVFGMETYNFYPYRTFYTITKDDIFADVPVLRFYVNPRVTMKKNPNFTGRIARIILLGPLYFLTVVMLILPVSHGLFWFFSMPDFASADLVMQLPVISAAVIILYYFGIAYPATYQDRKDAREFQPKEEANATYVDATFVSIPFYQAA